MRWLSVNQFQILEVAAQNWDVNLLPDTGVLKYNIRVLVKEELLEANPRFQHNPLVIPEWVITDKGREAIKPVDTYCRVMSKTGRKGTVKRFWYGGSLGVVWDDAPEAKIGHVRPDKLRRVYDEVKGQ